jgi:hypothetical protein
MSFKAMVATLKPGQAPFSFLKPVSTTGSDMRFKQTAETGLGAPLCQDRTWKEQPSFPGVEPGTKAANFDAWANGVSPYTGPSVYPLGTIGNSNVHKIEVACTCEATVSTSKGKVCDKGNICDVKNVCRAQTAADIKACSFDPEVANTGPCLCDPDARELDCGNDYNGKYCYKDVPYGVGYRCKRSPKSKINLHDGSAYINTGEKWLTEGSGGYANLLKHENKPGQVTQFSADDSKKANVNKRADYLLIKKNEGVGCDQNVLKGASVAADPCKNAGYYVHTVKQGETMHGIATYYYCGYGAMWDHIFSANVHETAGLKDAKGAAATFAAIEDADKLKLGQKLIIPIMHDARQPNPDKSPGPCPGQHKHFTR